MASGQHFERYLDFGSDVNEQSQKLGVTIYIWF